MKTVTINLYSFDELSKKAKERALSEWSVDEQYFHGDEALESLKKFCEHFGAVLNNYDIDWQYPGRNTYQIDTEGIELSEKELKDKIKAMGSYNKKTLRGKGDCVFTGVCFDEDLGDGARKAYFNGERDIEKIIRAGIKEWEQSCEKDADYQFSIEGFAEHCEANEYTFEKSGKMKNA